MVKVALEVTKRRLVDVDDIIDKKKFYHGVRDSEWSILCSDEPTVEDLAHKKHAAWLNRLDLKPKKRKKKKKKKQAKKNQQDANEDNEEEEQNPLVQEIEDTLELLEQKNPQHNLVGLDNVWILKPAGLSRGRGIVCHNFLVEILDHVKCKETSFLAQKYIENPLLIKNRKFDVRQWVMITDWNPLQIWFYRECYVRFCAEDYNTDKLSNNFAHLTNNSIQKHGKNFNDDNQFFENFMWDQQQFADYLKQEAGYDVFYEKIQPQFKRICKWSLSCVQDKFVQRKNTVEQFGYDFMVDDQYNVWLIEVNSSPTMEYSTPITKRLVQDMLSDTAKVLVEWKDAPKKKRKTIDTGDYELITRKRPVVTNQHNSIGLSLSIEGTKINKK